jgi:thiamine-monophosphate kinase
MIDISDGLSSEIMHLCKQSGVGCNLYEDKLPLDPQLISVCEEFDIDSTTVAMVEKIMSYFHHCDGRF